MLSEKGLHFLAVAADAPQPPPAPAAVAKPAAKEKWAPSSSLQYEVRFPFQEYTRPRPFMYTLPGATSATDASLAT